MTNEDKKEPSKAKEPKTIVVRVDNEGFALVEGKKVEMGSTLAGAEVTITL